MKFGITDAAREAAASDLPAGGMLRIAFAGGCGALGFRLSTARRALEDDRRVEVEDLVVLLDRQAIRELDGATLDWQEEEGFVLDHPSWGTSC